MVILPGAFSAYRPAVVINLATGERARAVTVTRWAGDPACWAVVDETGKRRIFKQSGRDAHGDPFIIANYRLED